MPKLEDLPFDILLQITKSLSKFDQQRLALVNHYWCNWARRNYLFDTVYLHGTAHPDKTLDFFEKDNFGKNTKYLAMTRDFIQYHLFSRMVKIFPNVKWLRVNFVLPPPKRSDEFVDLVKKWTRLERIDGDVDGFLIKPLLKLPSSTAMLKMVSLEYPDDEYMFGNPSHSSATQAMDISNLSNTRRLESLTLQGARVNSKVLKQVHEAVPNLKSLRLLSPSDNIEIGFSPESVTEDELKTIDALDNLSIVAAYQNMFFNSLRYGHQLMEFISKVYTDIKSFQFLYDDWPLGIGNKRGVVRQSICRALSNWHNLKSYKVKLCPLDKTILETMKKAGIKLTDLWIAMTTLSSPLWQDQYAHLAAFPEVTENLMNLSIGEYKTTKRDGIALCKFLRTLPKLENLHVTNNDSKHGFSFIASILEANPRIKLLDLPMISDPFGTLSMLQSCQLTRLRIDCIPVYLTTSCVNSINKNFEALISHCPLLERFDVHIKGRKFKRTQDEDAVLIFNFEDSHHIQEIRVTSVTQADFEVTVQGRRTVCHKIEDEDTRHLLFEERRRYDKTNARIAILASDAPTIFTNVQPLHLLTDDIS